MDKQSGPGIADLRARTLQPLPHGVKTARNRCRANLQIHSRRWYAPRQHRAQELSL